ncbi:unnamed protein product [Pedinophyceae sp. YPF-701]|nr:unnamed protein product [Pedinophyceae sp. YPF-701]
MSRWPVGFGWSAGGLCFPYYVGVLDTLRRAGVADQAHMAGASAGALIAGLHGADVPTETIVDGMHHLYADLRAKGTYGRLHEPLRWVMGQFLPDDAHERASGRVHLAVTRVYPSVQSHIISKFHSKEDLLETMLLSSHVPLFLQRGSLARPYRRELGWDGYWVDGGFTNFIPLPPGARLTKRICCFPLAEELAGSGRYGQGLACTPDFHPEVAGGREDYTMDRMLRWAFQPASEEEVDALVAMGRADAELMIRKCEGLSELSVSGSLDEEDCEAVARKIEVPR